MNIIWKDKTDCFTERQRHYKKLYLESSEVYDDKVEVSLFSSLEVPYEIYVSYGKMYGIIYTDENEAYSLLEEIKKDIEEEIMKNKFNPSNKFIESFMIKYNLCIPSDVFFDF